MFLNLKKVYSLFMKVFCLVFCLIFISSCSSTEKASYDSIMKRGDFLKKENNSFREIAYLKNISQFKEDNFQFITKQMKKVIKNYSLMKKHLKKIETKLDRILGQQILGNNFQKKIKL